MFHYTYIDTYTHTYTRSSLSIHLLMATYLAFMPWQLSRMRLWKLGCMYLFKLVVSSLTSICLGVGLAAHTIALFLFFWGTSIPFSLVISQAFIPPHQCRRAPFLHVLCSVSDLQTLWWWPFSWLGGDGSSWFRLRFPDGWGCCCPSGCLLWRNVSSGLLLIF